MQIRFDEIPVPEDKLNAVVGRNMQKVRNVYKRRQKRKNLVRWASAAAAVVLITVFCFTNPVLAAKIPLIGHIFKQVQDEQRYTGNFDEVAQPLADNNSSTSEGVTITLSEIYSNKEAMYVSAMVESEEPFPEEVKESNIIEGAEPGYQDIGYHMYLSIEQEFDFMKAPEEYEPYEWPGEEFEWTELDLKGEYVDEHTFVGAIRIDFSLYPTGMFEVPDAFNWKLRVSKIDILENYEKDGSWEFDTDVTVDNEEPEVISVNESAPNGEVITAVTKTPYEVRVDFEYDESKVQEGYEDYSSVQSIMLDADGKHIIDKVGMFPAQGYNLSEINVYYYESGTEEEDMKIQEKIYDENFQDELQGYLEEISIQKTVIKLE